MGKNDARVVLVVMVVFAKNGGSRQGDKEGDEGRERERVRERRGRRL